VALYTWGTSSSPKDASKVVVKAAVTDPKRGQAGLLPPPFALRGTSTADGYRLVVEGELDLATAPALAEQLTAAERARPGVVTLDLSELSFISAAGMRVVLDAARRARSGGWRLVVLNPQPLIRRLLALSAVDRSLEIRFE
jgi:anti-sigma B factor antagonist